MSADSEPCTSSFRPPYLFHFDNHRIDSVLVQHALHFFKKLVKQRFGVLELVRPSGIGFRSVPMIAHRAFRFEPSTDGGHAMGIVVG